MSFRLLFRSLHFFALIFTTIRLVCFVVQEKKVGKNSCFGVSLFRGLVMPLTKTILATKVTSTCVFTSCPLHFASYQTCNITLNDCATFEIASSEWLMPNDSTHKRRFKGKPLPGVPNIKQLTNDGNGNNYVWWYCSGLRKYFPRQFVNFKNIYIFSVDLISRKRPLELGNLPFSVVLNSSTLYLHSETLWNGSHYISIICHFGTWYVYDGLKEHNVQHSGLSRFTIQPAGYIISHVVYCRRINLLFDCCLLD